MGNLFCGCLGVIFAFNDNLEWASYMIWFAGVMDFADGLVARMLKVSSDIGKQLDSLADVVSFGLLPSVIVYQLFLGHTQASLWPYVSFLIVIAAAYRLARFNLESSDDGNFKGLPTPAAALLISSLSAIGARGFSDQLFSSPLSWITLILIISYLMVSNLPLFGLKFKNLSWKVNRFRWLLVIIAIPTLLVAKIMAIPLIIVTYIGLSVLWQYGAKKDVDF